MKRIFFLSLILFPILLATVLPVVFRTGAVQGQNRQGQNRADIDLAALLDRVGERVKKYYEDLQRLAWTDSVRQQTLGEDRSPQGKPRDLVYEMILRLDSFPQRADVPPPQPPFFTKELAEL